MGGFDRLFLTYNTLKFLKPIQIFNRILRRFNRPKFRDINYTVSRQEKKIQRTELLPSSFIDNDRFCFLNMTDNVDNWRDQERSKLWLYNLHYFDDLNQKGAVERICLHDELVDSWIFFNPFMHGNGWEPYPLSLRIVNWIKWFCSLREPKKPWLDSLAIQVSALYSQLEYHLLGNHLLANAKALIFAGCYFDGIESDKWLEKGLNIFNKEIDEQTHTDGGNFELSPMYHNIILSDMLDLYNIACTYPDKIPIQSKEHWLSIILSMFEWAESMIHSDGDIAFFNDSSFGIAPSLSMLRDYACNLGVRINFCHKPSDKLRVRHLDKSGYIVVDTKHSKCILDVGRVGPDYIPGHAHADTLSFELSVAEQRILVNSGTSLYGSDCERVRQRGTEAHNTVTVDYSNSSEVWSGFRVARRALPSTPIIKKNANSVSVSCSHNGYLRLPGSVIHQRDWFFSEKELIVTDILHGDFDVAYAHYHIHPEIEVSIFNNIAILSGRDNIKVEIFSSEKIEVLDSTWHPSFGRSLPNKKLVIAISNQPLEIKVKF